MKNIGNIFKPYQVCKVEREVAGVIYGRRIAARVKVESDGG